MMLSLEALTTPFSEFWQFNIGHVMILMGMMASFLWWAVRYDRRISETISGLSVFKDETLKTFVEIQKNFSALNTRITQMDERGTRASSLSIKSETTLLESNIRRVEQLEKVISDLSPKVSTIESNVDWLVHAIRGDGSRKTPIASGS